MFEDSFAREHVVVATYLPLSCKLQVLVNKDRR